MSSASLRTGAVCCRMTSRPDHSTTSQRRPLSRQLCESTTAGGIVHLHAAPPATPSADVHSVRPGLTLSVCRLRCWWDGAQLRVVSNCHARV
eukprot:9016785-Alexandrium_andersonii.AAC.1